MLPEHKNQIEQKVDYIYNIAVDRHPTYETVIHREFCEQMLEEYPDPYSPEGVVAYKHARGRYGYLTPEQINEENALNEDDGICSHGLDWRTCPRGCFE